MQDRYQSVGIETALIKHGIVRTFKLEKRTKTALPSGGIHVMKMGQISHTVHLGSYQKISEFKIYYASASPLSPVIPTNSKVGNLEIYEFPYKKPITLEKIISKVF